MAQTLLVATERQIVSSLMDTFNDKDLDVRIVLLAKFEEYYGTRLVLSSPAFNEHKGLFDYIEFGNILRKWGLDFDDISLLLPKMSDPIVAALRHQLGAYEDARGTHLGPQTLGNRFVEEGYVYRVR